MTQFELMPEPPPERPDDRTPWPQWPLILRTSPAHEEGGERALRRQHHRAGGRERPRGRACAATRSARRRASTRSRAPSSSCPPTSCCWRWASCHPEHEGLVEQLAVDLDQRGNVDAGAVRHQRARRVRRGRRPPRPVARGLGDQRGPQGRPRRGRLPRRARRRARRGSRRRPAQRVVASASSGSLKPLPLLPSAKWMTAPSTVAPFPVEQVPASFIVGVRPAASSVRMRFSLVRGELHLQHHAVARGVGGADRGERDRLPALVLPLARAGTVPSSLEVSDTA